MSKIKKSELLDIVREQGSAITNLLQRVTLLEKSKLKQLDQSVFNGLDEKWRFAAVDKCGEVWYSTHKTQPSVSGTHLSPEPNANSMQAEGYYDASNWQNSLIERSTAKEMLEVDLSSELTGSDWVNHKDLKKPIERKPEPQLKQLDHSVFKQWDNCWKFIAINEDGRAWRYRKKPQIYNDGTSWSSDTTVPVLIGTGYDASNWQNSLIERGTTKNLASSDLCRAMLERGDKYVMCLLSDTSHAEALNSKPSIITNFVDGMGFIEDSKDQYWYFAIPINNQGRPLTSSDVGL